MKTTKQLNQDVRLFNSLISRELRRIRALNKVTTYDLQKAGFRSQQYKAIESGQLNMTIKRFRKYCDVIGAEVSISNRLPLTITIKPCGE